MHYWKPKTPKEKKEAEEDLTKLNEELKPYLKVEWEKNRKPYNAPKKRRGQQAIWKLDRSYGKIVCDSQGGID